MPLVDKLPLGPGTRQWPVWGTTARVVVTDPAHADDAQRLLGDQLAAVGAACSRFRDDSELVQVQRRLTERNSRPVLVSPLLADLLRAAIDTATRTDGDVDPTLADDLCALGYDRDYAQLEVRGANGDAVPVRLGRRVRYRWSDLRLADRRFWMPAGVHLDLGASAKAFAADRAAALAAARYRCGVLVALGGDIATAGNAPRAGWQILVQDGALEPASRVRLDGGALATSSTISRQWRNGTSAVHHILDPVSGQPADAVWRTVSVAADSCAEANALSTAAIVRGWRALPWLRAGRRTARLVSCSGEIVTLGGWPE